MMMEMRIQSQLKESRSNPQWQIKDIQRRSRSKVLKSFSSSVLNLQKMKMMIFLEEIRKKKKRLNEFSIIAKLWATKYHWKAVYVQLLHKTEYKVM